MNGESALRTLRTAGIWLGLAVGVFVLWEIRAALLLGLGAILVAILLRLIAHYVCRLTRLPHYGGLAAAVLLIVAVLLLCFWLFGTHLSSEFVQLGRHIQEGKRSLTAMLGHGAQADMQRGMGFISQAMPNVLITGITFLEYAVVTAIIAVYLAAQPEIYRRGAATLFPKSLHAKALEAFDIVGVSLKLWMMGQLVLMLLVGVLSFFAALLVGLPDPVALGLIAGVTEFIPYLGPFIGAVPAVLVALTKGLSPAIWIAAAYLAVHIFEGYLIGPLLQRWFVHIPPALILIGIVAIQLLFGTAGIFLAAPLTVACYTAVKFLYIGATLRRKIELPTEAPF